MSDLFADPRDLILRPTALEPGTYEGSTGPFIIIRHQSGRNYELIWYEAGDGKNHVQPGDTLCERAYIQDVQTTYPDDGIVQVEPLEISPAFVTKR